MKLIKIEGYILSTPEEIEQIVQSIAMLDPTELNIMISGNTILEQQFKDLARKSIDISFQFLNETSIIEKNTLNLIRHLLPVSSQSGALSFVKQRFNEFEDLCKGIQLLGEAPSRTLEEVNKIPSVILSHIFYAALTTKRDDVSFEGIGKQKQIHVIPAILTTNYHSNINFRSYSDLASAHFAIKHACKKVSFWKNKDIYYTADPLIVKNAKPIQHLSYEEAIELLNYDQQLIDPIALEMLINQELEVEFIHTEKPESTTRIKSKSTSNKGIVTGISSMDEISLINVEGSGMLGVPGFAKRVFSTLFDAGINIILISQGVSEHSICVGVKSNTAENARMQLEEVFADEIASNHINPVQIVNQASIIALVGENMRMHSGISGKMFNALGKNGINIMAIAQGANEKNISAVIKTSDKHKALNVLHEAFFEYTSREINAFIIGTGNVGKKLISQIQQQYEHILNGQNIKINIAGLCNSRNMIIQSEGINLASWDDALKSGEKANVAEFSKRMIALNLRNSVLIDMTANDRVPDIYSDVLKKSMSIVACNKVAASDSYQNYLHLKKLALEYNCKFLFETNVGAALPVIGTLNDIIKSGDQMHSIQAVLSGTLNYVFNNYDGQKTFAEVVKDAQIEGYTEPDPRLDLSGKDVMRKIMILAREAGYPLEMNDIQCNSFLPASCMLGSVDDFYKEMKNHEAHFQALLKGAQAANSKLKFVATFQNGKASVGLEHIKPENEMYHLYGKDNIVLFFTERYKDQPLVIKGAGAGAEVTASGVFADILRTIN